MVEAKKEAQLMKVELLFAEREALVSAKFQYVYQ